ncbi:MAG: hypothetical protein SF052_17400 [Bacteroidia bacterium]|nr:hypothetical protein [Bacteroidia bacterium]
MIVNKPYLHLEKTESGHRLDVIFSLPAGLDILPVQQSNSEINKILVFPVVSVEGQIHYSFKDFSFEFSGLSPQSYIDVYLIEIDAMGELSGEGPLGVTRVYVIAAEGEEDREGDGNPGTDGGTGEGDGGEGDD